MSKNIREQYNIPESAKIILYAGNISLNKNQVQLVRAFDKMNPDVCANTWVLFCGIDLSDGQTLRQVIADSPYKEHFILCGGIDKELMPLYFKAADGVVLLSVAEGFGLSLIEGMHFGKPCLMFTDLDAFEDIYDEKAVVPVDKRTGESVAQGVELLLRREWDMDAIIECSRKFESSSMANQYVNVYKTILAA